MGKRPYLSYILYTFGGGIGVSQLIWEMGNRNDFWDDSKFLVWAAGRMMLPLTEIGKAACGPGWEGGFRAIRDEH